MNDGIIPPVRFGHPGFIPHEGNCAIVPSTFTRREKGNNRKPRPSKPRRAGGEMDFITPEDIQSVSCVCKSSTGSGSAAKHLSEHRLLCLWLVPRKQRNPAKGLPSLRSPVDVGNKSAFWWMTLPDKIPSPKGEKEEKNGRRLVSNGAFWRPKRWASPGRTNPLHQGWDARVLFSPKNGEDALKNCFPETRDPQKHEMSELEFWGKAFTQHLGS